MLAHTPHAGMYSTRSRIGCITCSPTRGSKHIRIDYNFCTDKLSYVPGSTKVRDDLSLHVCTKKTTDPCSAALPCLVVLITFGFAGELLTMT